nr:MAG TPA: SWIM zinc finger protein [Caudoviricetes sp.]
MEHIKSIFFNFIDFIYGYKTSFKIKSDSSKEIYQVTFKVKNKELISSCNCEAGKNGYICKHRTDLLIGDYSNIINSDIKSIKKLTKIINNSKLSEYKTYFDRVGLLKKIKQEKFNYPSDYFSNSYLNEEFKDETIFMPEKDDITISLEDIENFLLKDAFLVSKDSESELLYCWDKNFNYKGEISKKAFKNKFPIGIKSNKFEINGKKFSCFFPKNKKMAQYYILADNHPLREIFNLSSIKEERKILNHYVRKCSLYSTYKFPMSKGTGL